MDDLASERWQRIRSILDAAFEVPPSARPALLQDLCGGDATLQAEVEALLAADAGAGSLLEAPLAEYADALLIDLVSAVAGRESMVGRQAGAYRLVREVGRGGMGTVYLAERADGQFEQRVAVKLLHRGRDTDDLLRRFLTERQILASLSHPNIAHLLDGGATEDGRPFLVMEFVEGLPIDAYCDAHRLGIEERLALFVTVARAVQHAHRNLVVHRDLKPSNIFVSAAGEVKLLDFGIAKLLEAEHAVGPVPLTRTGALLLTPEYSSPEQLKGEPITTASDVYQLGLLLYELLTGQRPYELAARTPAEVERIVCHEEVPRPSTAVARALHGPPGGRSEEAIATARRTTPERLRKRLRSDLDAIVVESLHKEPDRRYPSVEALAVDVERHLEGLPVRARGDSRLYRARRLVWRHRWGAAVATLVLLLLSGYAVTTSVQADRIRAALEMAHLETAKAEQVTDFLLDLFSASRPEHARGEDVTARALLAQGVERAETLEDQPEVRATVLAVIGKTHHRLGMYEEAQRLYEHSLELREQHFGAQNKQVAESLNDLGVLLKDRGQFAAAEPLLLRSLDIRRRLLGENHQDLAVTLDEIGRLLQERGEHERAERYFREGLAIRLRVLGEEHHESASSLNSVALVLRNQGKHDEAEPLLRQALRIYLNLFGEGHPWVATARSNLALIHIEREDWAGAESLLRQALDTDLRAHGSDHPSVAIRLNHLATVHRERGLVHDADTLLTEAVRIVRSALGESHPLLVTFLTNHGRVLLSLGETAAAAALLRQAVEVGRETLPAGDNRTAEAEGWLGTALSAIDGEEEAEPFTP